MKLDNLDKSKKRKIMNISVFFGIFLILVVFTGFILNYNNKHSRDTIRLSDIQRLRADLELFYYNYNIFPSGILSKNTVKNREDCLVNLCLEYYPEDPKTKVIYDYTPCAGNADLNCEDSIDYASNYTLTYNLETAIGGISAGSHIASPDSICADCKN